MSSCSFLLFTTDGQNGKIKASRTLNESLVSFYACQKKNANGINIVKGGLTVTDSEIISLLFSREEQGLRQTKEKYGKLLFSLSKNILGSDEDAAECENDTYFALWKSVPPKVPDPLSSFLCRIAKNLSLKRLREKTALKRTGITVPLDELGEAVGCDELQKHLDAKRLGKLIDSFLDTLDSENRRLFVKRYWFCCDTSALAAEFGLSENTVHKRLSRTRQKLKAYLIKEGAYDE